jgi:predicted TIM-barrel fold metal-dependent hydrolase
MTARSAAIRASLPHPVIDADGHFVEIGPLLHDELVAELEREGGAALRERYLASGIAPTDTSAILAGRTLAGARDRWSAMPSWWGWPTENARDRATAHLPALLYDRLDEMGIDLMIAYPSMALGLLDLVDPELARAACRAVNAMHARLFAPYRDRILPGALVSLVTPEVGLDVLEHAVATLGLRAGVISSYVRRPIAAIARLHGATVPPVYRCDVFGIDSEFDYDPFWARCTELAFAPASHGGFQYHRVARSPSSYVYNHIAGLAHGHEALAKALVLGGVLARFPRLRLAFLEGGVAWACSLLADLVGHFEKRNGDAIHALDPARLDVDALMALFRSFGGDDLRRNEVRLRAYFSDPGARPAEIDEFRSTGAKTSEELVSRFTSAFAFGCEADDPLVKWAFAADVNPHGARLRALFGSDISHWDVPDMTEPVEEAHELVERGLVTPEEFRDFAFANAVRFHGGANPRFFEGTRCEKAAAEVLAAEAHA